MVVYTTEFYVCVVVIDICAYYKMYGEENLCKSYGMSMKTVSIHLLI